MIATTAIAAVLISALGPLGSSPAEASTGTVVLPDRPDTFFLDASYDTGPGDVLPAIPSSVETFTLLLPAQTTLFDLDSIDVGFASDQYTATIPATIDPATNSVTVPIPAGALTSMATPEGTSQLRYGVYEQTADPDDPLAKVSHVGLGGFLRIVPADGTTSFSKDLARAESSEFSLLKQYTLPENDDWVVPGGAIKIQTPTGMTWNPDNEAELASATDEREMGQISQPRGPAHSGLHLSTSLNEAGFVLTARAPVDPPLTSVFTDHDGFTNLHLVSRATDDPFAADIDLIMTGTFADTTTIPGVLSSRTSGPDRFRGAIAMSIAAHREWTYYFDPVPVVYIASGMNFPDALSAAPIAAAAGGPLLLVPPTVDDSVDGEINRLGAPRIVIVGGENSVSAEWQAHFEAKFYSDRVTRLSGPDRYAASRALAAASFPSGASTAFLATGANYPDALSAVSSAASIGAPVILVPGTAATLDAATASLLESLGVSHVTIVGGPASVSPGIEADVTALVPDTIRLGGSDRFEAATSVNAHYFSTATRTYLASGLTFPDALAGGVLAAVNHAPLLLAHTDCVPSTTLQTMAHWGTSQVSVLGGTATLNRAAAALTACH
ncbi:cell wall-binding repeat-containing protein [Herbiconiux sp. CPCC 205763]|uniref:Cell wall-binding repeat-containing protein n=1 Tax=Herbiconiux aconitum TaxID=2970913 RepID=A0ABT2GM34_9MICO|nr:cell wall-binding repeat-containing protein [Herbiconiux aconitum]MCS5717233.1 cell wall-binding repeat-containing protein [Herbiconiux aconitum]